MNSGCISHLTNPITPEPVYGCLRKFCKTSVPKTKPKACGLCITVFKCPAATVNGNRWRI